MDTIIRLIKPFAGTTLAMAFFFTASSAAAQSCGACDNIVEGDVATEHWAVAWWNDSGPADTPNDYHFSTESGSCAAHHDWCEGGMNLAQALIEAVAEGDLLHLSELMTASSAVVVESRQAIQILGCDGELIVGHVPVNEALMASLRTAVANLADSQ